MDRNYDYQQPAVEAMMAVRLVRACGSKQEELKVSEWAERVRLVRACGSKLLSLIRSQ